MLDEVRTTVADPSVGSSSQEPISDSWCWANRQGKLFGVQHHEIIHFRYIARNTALIRGSCESPIKSHLLHSVAASFNQGPRTSTLARDAWFGHINGSSSIQVMYIYFIDIHYIDMQVCRHEWNVIFCPNLVYHQLEDASTFGSISTWSCAPDQRPMS